MSAATSSMPHQDILPLPRILPAESRRSAPLSPSRSSSSFLLHQFDWLSRIRRNERALRRQVESDRLIVGNNEIRFVQMGGLDHQRVIDGAIHLALRNRARFGPRPIALEIDAPVPAAQRNRYIVFQVI